jgi:hypothetical protein
MTIVIETGFPGAWDVVDAGGCEPLVVDETRGPVALSLLLQAATPRIATVTAPITAVRRGRRLTCRLSWEVAAP